MLPALWVVWMVHNPPDIPITLPDSDAHLCDEGDERACARRRESCERAAEYGPDVFDKDTRLQLRERTRAPNLPAGAPDWEALRGYLDDYLHSWSELRMRACTERRTELERCLDRRVRTLSRSLEAWSDGDLGWATTPLDELVPAATHCVDRQTP
ncbi:hypothetical protein ENSA7_80400 [Enhygromyxa salina]|uniref:Uncharacterized protein n=2 Tax=Enhygromyxa salina TaxID=215803 RepID=A0A2S9XL96_9BACT|nr:hypothetical protein ENSA7_80400 [Enhygromyxa salina]